MNKAQSIFRVGWGRIDHHWTLSTQEQPCSWSILLNLYTEWHQLICAGPVLSEWVRLLSPWIPLWWGEQSLCGWFWSGRCFGSLNAGSRKPGPEQGPGWGHTLWYPHLLSGWTVLLQGTKWPVGMLSLSSGKLIKMHHYEHEASFC